MKKTRILSLTTDKGFGGAEKVFNSINNSLLDNFEVHECFFNTNSKDFYKSNCIEHHLDVNSGKNIFSKLFHFFIRIKKFRDLVNEIKPDIIISHLEGADYVSLLTFKKVKKICVFHGSKTHDKNINGFIGFIRKRITIPLIYKLSNRIVTVSNGIKEELIKNYYFKENQINVINNSIDLSRIEEMSREKIENEFLHIFKNKVLVTCCRLAPEKNILNMIKIFEKINEQGIKLVIIGDGQEKNNLIEYLRTTNLIYKSIWNNNLNQDADIYFLGYQSNPFKYINKSTLYLLTSTNEGFPLGPLEAMASSTVVISSNCPTGPDEILKGEEIKEINEIDKKSYAGVLLPIPSESDKTQLLWSDTITLLLNDKTLQLKFNENSKNRISKLSPENIKKKWEKLILGVLSNEN